MKSFSFHHHSFCNSPSLYAHLYDNFYKTLKEDLDSFDLELFQSNFEYVDWYNILGLLLCFAGVMISEG